jgi:hypothetical protein
MPSPESRSGSAWSPAGLTDTNTEATVGLSRTTPVLDSTYGDRRFCDPQRVGIPRARPSPRRSCSCKRHKRTEHPQHQYHFWRHPRLHSWRSVSTLERLQVDTAFQVEPNSVGAARDPCGALTDDLRSALVEPQLGDKDRRAIQPHRRDRAVALSNLRCSTESW